MLALLCNCFQLRTCDWLCGAYSLSAALGHLQHLRQRGLVVVADDFRREIARASKQLHVDVVDEVGEFDILITRNSHTTCKITAHELGNRLAETQSG